MYSNVSFPPPPPLDRILHVVSSGWVDERERESNSSCHLALLPSSGPTIQRPSPIALREQDTTEGTSSHEVARSMNRLCDTSFYPCAARELFRLRSQ